MTFEEALRAFAAGKKVYTNDYQPAAWMQTRQHVSLNGDVQKQLVLVQGMYNIRGLEVADFLTTEWKVKK